ncbi:Myb-like DNA-binding domain containing protein [Trichomonas vaginalis G3]|uniref:Myb-like DNA-binding domain containing protein n=1 Tax=Trichomonas vaginalis (strain ATCC PRA-98 / G3) TaxID=412133 RepID=A2FFR0_TRIV3|nr:homeodomain-like family [Trichomonas vaginalis G3]EAX96244.1 Myb-like DNA-binding domain containing protein [Trichomonas vaginalis G3]KAI5516248.1 homeodomain-like family [Trichomonas vaginalis G3]|eukprot:XP_001309174.1 Myb-like DNA-binding domain containing protein [Trichomonas vaginalis G3]
MSANHEAGDICSSPIAESGEHYEGASVNVGVSYNFPKPAEYDSWTPCKKQSWDQLQTNPNGFFYRHVLPNEKRKNGPWSEEEKQLFIEALRKQPAENTHWGLFARNIPGRVGYQCNAFYKKLIASGELQEIAPDIKFTPLPAKAVDENGKVIVRKRKQHITIGGVEVIPGRDSFASESLLECVDIEPVVLKNQPETISFRTNVLQASPQLRKHFISSSTLFF